MRVDAKEEFERSSDYDKAFESYKATELYHCCECDEYFDQPDDINTDGQCRMCRAMEKQLTGH